MSELTRIVIVEDQEDIREGLVILLDRADREIVDFGSAEAALVALERRPCNVLLTDVGLPGMSGLELAEHVLQRWSATGVVIASGLDSQQDDMAHDRVRRIVKPFSVDELSALIDSLAHATTGP